MSFRRGALTTLAVATGLALLVWQIRAVGAAEIGRGLATIGWTGAVMVAALSLGRFVARAAGWIVLLGDRARLDRATAAFIVGDTAGHLTPLSLLVSEPTKAAYLGYAGGAARAMAALAVENYFFGVSVALYAIAGSAAMLAAFDVDATTRLLAMVALGAMAAVLAVAAWLAWSKPAMASALLRRAPVARLRALADRVRVFEDDMYRRTGGSAASVLRVGAAAAVFHLLSFAEMWAALWLLSGSSQPLAAFVLDTVSRLANVFFKMIPFQLGVLQVGSEIVARAIGLPPGAGVTLSLVRTARGLFWAVVGLALGAMRWSKQSR